MKTLSLIVNVLESYPIVRRQLSHLGHILTPECELILVDDGSVPSLRETCDSVPKNFDFIFHATNDTRPWTQPAARNVGARLAHAPKLLFFDIDHIVTREVLNLCLAYEGDRLHWWRRPGILDEAGNIVTDRRVLLEYGLKDENPSIHANSYLIRRELFDRLGGYDERYCGRYGGDDIDFNKRYEELCRAGVARPAETVGQGYYYPDPAMLKEHFHSLRREVAPAPSTHPQRPQTHYRMRSAEALGVSEATCNVRLRDRTVQVRFSARGPVDRSILDEVWEKDIYGVRATSRPPEVVVDIGAHIGAFSLMAAQAWPAARIIAAEPDPENVALLRSNLGALRNVEIVEAAIVGDDVNHVILNRVIDKIQGNSGGGSCMRDEPGTEKTTVPAMSASKLWSSKSISRCDLLKLDCEGAEAGVLADLARAGFLGQIRHIVGAWHSPDATEPSREAAKQKLGAILRETHHLALLPHGTGREGRFFATRREDAAVTVVPPAGAGSEAAGSGAQ